MTKRESIEDLLKEGPHSVTELAHFFSVDKKIIIEDLKHVKESYRHFFKTIPSKCNVCGFVFKEREKLKTPSRCPMCKEEDISEARFFIEEG